MARSRSNAGRYLAVSILVGAAGAADAQILPRGSISITNVGNAAINFRIRSGVTDWSEQSIASGRSVTFDCRCAAFEATIPTDKDSVTRTLPIGRAYRIYWNATDKRWDIGTYAKG